jgi:hypothetical protein
MTKGAAALLLATLLLLIPPHARAWTLWGGSAAAPTSKAKAAASAAALELVLTKGIQELKATKKPTSSQVETVERAIGDLEALGKGRQTACDPRIDGRWRLLFTTTNSTASPIQRTATLSDLVKVYQNVAIYSETPPTIANVVLFEPWGKLEVRALASTQARPLKGFIPRRGDGKILGLNILGVSEKTPPPPETRLDFKFDDAFFEFKQPFRFRIPYPVPFRYLGDDVKGWVDVSYLGEGDSAGTLRISRGNKGTIFVLQRE